MMFVSRADRPHGPDRRAIDEDPRPGRGRRLAVEDAHLVVDQLDIVELRVEVLAAPCAARASSAFTGPLPSAAVCSDLAVDLDLDGRLGAQVARRRAARR